MSESRISVCMATYNGAAFVEEQVRSILEQLAPQDELVVVDDCSKDDTVRLLQQLGDPRVVVHRNEVNRGHVYSFGRAIGLARNPVVMLSDQDDIWLRGRVRLLVDTLRDSRALLVTSNSDYIDTRGIPIDYPANKLSVLDSDRNLKNILAIFTGKSGYFGCAMAFRRELVSLVLPMPRFVESHDLWIALGGNLVRSNAHVEDASLARRIHGGNLTTNRRSFLLKLLSRVLFLQSLAVLAGRYLLQRRIRRGLRASTAG